MTTIQPKLTFYCELATDELEQLFADDTVIEQIIALSASISLAIFDLSDRRATIVKRLNQAGIPVIAWLLLPIADGYWFNINNVDSASRHYDAFKQWTADHDLQWDGIGLDIEPDRREIDAIIANTWAFLPFIANKLINRTHWNQASAKYNHLVRRMKSDGYRVDSYHLPIIVEDRLNDSQMFQRLMGLVDLDSDRDILMLYTSFMGDSGQPLFWVYAPYADSIGVGSTGGGVEIADFPIRILSWEALERDLLAASQHKSDIHIFSLEGCVKEGYLARINTIDWSRTVAPPTDRTGMVYWGRFFVETIQFAWKYGVVLVGTLMIVVIINRRKK